jgi:hypothetical protein
LLMSEITFRPSIQVRCQQREAKSSIRS